jgi:hypothetical protein
VPWRWRATRADELLLLDLNTVILGIITALNKVPSYRRGAVAGNPAGGDTRRVLHPVLPCSQLPAARRREHRVVERPRASPLWRGKRWSLGDGRDPVRYWPLSHIEQWNPVLFTLNLLWRLPRRRSCLGPSCNVIRNGLAFRSRADAAAATYSRSERTRRRQSRLSWGTWWRRRSCCRRSSRAAGVRRSTPPAGV